MNHIHPSNVGLLKASVYSAQQFVRFSIVLRNEAAAATNSEVSTNAQREGLGKCCCFSG
jgi:hypothetical protein